MSKLQLHEIILEIIELQLITITISLTSTLPSTPDLFRFGKI